MKFSSLEEDKLAIFLLPMPVYLPGGEVGVSASFRTISFSFEAVRDEYLSRTQRLRKWRPSRPFCTRHKLAPWPKTDNRYIIGASLSEPHMYEKYSERVYIYIYIYSIQFSSIQ